MHTAAALAVASRMDGERTDGSGVLCQLERGRDRAERDSAEMHALEGRETVRGEGCRR